MFQIVKKIEKDRGTRDKCINKIWYVQIFSLIMYYKETELLKFTLCSVWEILHNRFAHDQAHTIMYIIIYI